MMRSVAQGPGQSSERLQQLMRDVEKAGHSASNALPGDCSFLTSPKIGEAGSALLQLELKAHTSQLSTLLEQAPTPQRTAAAPCRRARTATAKRRTCDE